MKPEQFQEGTYRDKHLQQEKNRIDHIIAINTEKRFEKFGYPVMILRNTRSKLRIESSLISIG